MTKFLATLILAIFIAAAAISAEDASKPCGSPEAAQLDFWIGEWKLSWGEDGRGTNVISKELGGCVIQENFDGGAFKGRSWSVYDPKGGQWRQTWVDNSGAYMAFTGGMEGERMILGREIEKEGVAIKQRMVFYNIAADSFDWDWEKSSDGGESWELAWRIHYERKGE